MNRNVGEPCWLLGEIPARDTGYQLQVLAAHSSARERKQRVHPRYRQAKETKCGGIAAGRHSVLILLDKWFEQGVKPRMRQPACLIRYADDFVIALDDLGEIPLAPVRTVRSTIRHAANP